MKKIVILLLAITLAACSSPAPQATQPAAVAVEPSATPVVVVQTVVVPASPAPTDVPPPTAVPPTAVPPTAVPPVVVTVVVQPTQGNSAQPTQPAAATQASGNAPIALDNALGKGVFTNMTMSSNAFTLRCSPRDITFNITTANTDIKDVVFYYRTSDLKRLYPKPLTAFGKMVSNGNGNFTLTFSGENITPDYRLDGSLFDFQFIGLNKGGARVDSSQIIEDLVKFTFDCP